MRWLGYLILAGLAASAAPGGSVTKHRSVFDDLADRARSLPAEFAANALLRLAEAPALTDVAKKRGILEDAFELAAGAQQPFARRNWTGSPGSLFDKAYAQGLDACTLQCRAVHDMLAIDYRKAREMFGEVQPPHIPRLDCEDALVYDVSIFYVTAGEMAARAFNAKEVADEEPFQLLLRYAGDLTSPAQLAPIARMLVTASLKPAQFEALLGSFAGALEQVEGDDRSFSGTVPGDASAAIADLSAECARRKINAQGLQAAWQAYLARQLSGARCADSVARRPQPSLGAGVKPASIDGKAQPAGECKSPECRKLATQFSSLIVGPNGFGLTPEQKMTSEWGGRLQQYLAALAEWTEDDDPVEYFQAKSRIYSDLYNVTPNGPNRDLLLSTLLIWLQGNSYQRDHRVEWFYPVNTLIIHAFADPRGMRRTMLALQRSADPVIALYAKLEQLLPRPMAGTIGLL